MPTPPDRPELGSALDEVLDHQLRDGEPPETQPTLDRLLGEGLDRDEARRLLKCVLAGELFAVMKTSTPFDCERFRERLAMLPALSWMEDE